MILNKYIHWATAIIIFAAILMSTSVHGKAPALWRVADRNSEIWLFGTVHLLPPQVRWRSRAFDDAFKAADTIILEVDLNAPPQRGLGPVIKQLGHNANYAALSSLLGARDTGRLAHAAKKLGVPPETLEPLRPWLASIRLSLTNIKSQGFEPRSGVDRIIAGMADAANKRLGYLETAEEQFEIFASLSPPAEIAFLMATVQQIESGSGGLTQLVAAWAEGDTGTFNRQFRESLGGDFPELRNALFINRNRRWTEQITRMMTGSGKALIAVGAGHLAGKDGVVGLLRAKGYKVTRQ